MLNSIAWCRWIYIRAISWNKVFDVVIMDPPRKCSDDTFLGIILKTHPKRVVYVSCNPATLAKNLKILSKDYDIKSVTPVDMFPNTIYKKTIVWRIRGLYFSLPKISKNSENKMTTQKWVISGGGEYVSCTDLYTW